MKPKNLISPFKPHAGLPLLHDRIYYIPSVLAPSISLGLDWQQLDLFSVSQPVCIEYCSGNGTWIVAKALERPDRNWVAVEYQFERVRKIWAKLKNSNLDNLLIICGEAAFTTRKFFLSESVEEVYINFPDPWPKKRHAKYRLINFAFVAEVKRILKSHGQLTLVTDDEMYSETMVKTVSREGGFTPLFAFPHYQIEYSNYGTSSFEKLWREKGKAIRYHVFRKEA